MWRVHQTLPVLRPLSSGSINCTHRPLLDRLSITVEHASIAHAINESDLGSEPTSTSRSAIMIAWSSVGADASKSLALWGRTSSCFIGPCRLVEENMSFDNHARRRSCKQGLDSSRPSQEARTTRASTRV